VQNVERLKAGAGEILFRGRNTDGGWGYYAGKASRLEPTCWALLALGGEPAASIDAAVLRDWPSRDGLLLERRDGDANYAFHGLALLTLLAIGVEHAAGNATLAAALQRVSGIAIPASTINRQDNSIRAWSWIADTFSWVEPTAWCLLALKKWATVPGQVADGSRIDQAERLLIDRACLTGGWNYGNSNMLGQELQPYVPTSAIALLAMQDRRDDDAVQRSLRYLEENATSERAGFSLALAAIALAVHGRDAGAARKSLAAQLPVTETLGNHAAIAAAFYALSTDKARVTFKL
jgi:hypothetical protein